jgi:glutamate/tyrosine decarboxylase-like PLP-dependent enzyme
MHHTPQASQRARQIEVWAALRTLGRGGVEELVQRGCRQARALADRLAAAGLEVVNEVVLNQVLVRAPDDRLTPDLVGEVQRDGTCWCGPTEWGGRPAMRISVSGWATSDEDVERSAVAITEALRRISPGAAGSLGQQ